MVVRKVRFSSGALAAAVVLAGCGGGAASTDTAPIAPPVEVPAGVDSLVAARADSIAESSFVAAPAQDEAEELQEVGRLIVERTDSLWLAMEALLDTGRVVTEADSAEAAAETNEGGMALVQLDSLLRAPDVDMDALASQTAMLLDSAQTSLERAFQLNPFDSRSQVWLAQVYGLQARRLGQEESYDRAISELEKLTLLTPDQHSVYAMLANNYFFVEDWDAAAVNYGRAEEVYLETWDLVVEGEPVLDSATVYAYVQAQGDMHVQRLDASRAETAYDRALPWATTPEDSAYVAGELEWMAWDDMNIASSFTRDSLLSLESEGDLEGARSGYQRLLPDLSARLAIDETEWRLSIVEYNLGIAEPAAERLLALVQRTATDVDGQPLDEAYQRYFDDYGTLCLNLGRSARADRRDNRTALKYFTQATELNWSGRAVAHYEVARLVQGNLPVALEHANSAAADAEAIPVEQRLDLYRLLMELNRRNGDFEQARIYRDAFQALRGERGGV